MTKRISRTRRTYAAASGVIAAIASSAVLGAPGTAALASPAAFPPYVCGKAGSGQTWATSGGNQGSATQFTK